jgi:hypothetical protein
MSGAILLRNSFVLSTVVFSQEIKVLEMAHSTQSRQVLIVGVNGRSYPWHHPHPTDVPSHSVNFMSLINGDYTPMSVRRPRRYGQICCAS